MKDRLYSEPYRFAFFQAVRLLERLARQGGRRPGRDGPGTRSSASGRTRRSSSRRARSSTSRRRPPGGDRPPEMTVAFIGPTGPLGVLPHPYTELVRRAGPLQGHAPSGSSSTSSTTASSPSSTGPGRSTASRSRYERQRRRPVHRRPLRPHRPRDGRAPRPDGGPRRGPPPLRGASSPRRPHSAGAIEAILRDYFGVPVAILQFVGAVARLEPEDRPELGEREQPAREPTRRGGLHVSEQPVPLPGPARARSPSPRFPRSSRAGRAWKPLTDLVRFLVGLEYDFDVQLVLKKEEVPACSLGSKSALPADARVDDVAHERPAPAGRREIVLRSMN